MLIWHVERCWSLEDLVETSAQAGCFSGVTDLGCMKNAFKRWLKPSMESHDSHELKPPRSSFTSWTAGHGQPNRLVHEEWKKEIQTFMVFAYEEPTAFKKLIARKRLGKTQGLWSRVMAMIKCEHSEKTTGWQVGPWKSCLKHERIPVWWFEIWHIFYCPSNLEMMLIFDCHFSTGLKPPTRKIPTTFRSFHDFLPFRGTLRAIFFGASKGKSWREASNSWNTQNAEVRYSWSMSSYLLQVFSLCRIYCNVYILQHDTNIYIYNIFIYSYYDYFPPCQIRISRFYGHLYARRYVG